jgi:hypothetical protein
VVVLRFLVIVCGSVRDARRSFAAIFDYAI